MADIQVGVMLRSLLIALVVVAPFGVVLWRRVRARAAAQEPPTVPIDAPALDHRPSLEALIEEISRLGDRADPTATVTVTVPHALTVDGSDAPPAVVDAIVRDALSRSGLAPTAELDTDTARVLECRLLRTTGPSST
jgi:hypothetical protein